MRARRLLLILTVAAGIAAPAAAATTEIRRRVLALYKSSEGDSEARNQTAALLEQPMESLGLAVDYADADTALPADAEMARYRGVVTFFRGPVMTDAKNYLSWMDRQIAAGRRFVVFGELGAMQDRASGKFLTHAEVNGALAPLGLRYDGYGTADRRRVSLVSAAPMMSFEEPFSAAGAATYQQIRPLTAGATAYLTLTRTDLPDGLSTPVVATAAGGFAGRDFLLHEYRQAGLIKQRWHLDPYAFLTVTLDLGAEPRFEGATLNGRRLWMAHIDGDGLASPAEAGLLCGQVIYDRVLSAYRLPVSVSVITGDLAKEPRAAAVAREMFALPNVEAASHSATHPQDWTAAGVNLADEIDGSIRTLNERYLPAGKTVRLFTWSALANPTAEALRRLSALGVANINGVNGDGGFTNRFDRLYPSRTHLSPMTRRVGGFAQLYHRASNDFDLTGGWASDRRDGYENIIETFERTASNPEIPVNAYFHFYSGESLRSLRALTSVFDWASRNAVTPVFVSDYARLVADFQTATLNRDADGRVIVTNAGACRTVVFPNPGLTVDVARSENVVGYSDRHGRLYVFLDGAPRHVIALTDRPAAAASVASASAWVDAMRVSGAEIRLETRSIGPTELALRLPKDGAWEIRVTSADDADGKHPFLAAATADNGMATFRFDGSGRDRIRISPVSRTAGAGRRAGLPLLAFSLAAFPIYALVRARRRLDA